METYDQGGLFTVSLDSIVPIEGEMKGDMVMLWVETHWIDEGAFEKALNEVFKVHTVDIYRKGYMVTMQMNAQDLHDGDDDYHDIGNFLQAMAKKILDWLVTHTDWTGPKSPNRHREFDRLD